MAYTPFVPNYNYSQYNQPQYSQPVIRSVYSEAEARNAQIPTDGTTVFFQDSMNGKIYTKSFSFQDGSFPFEVYEKSAAKPPVQYATLEDLRALREELTKHE